MKYLIQHRKEFAITVAGFVIAVINLIRAIRQGEINEDLIVTVIFTGVAILGWYYNMPTSEENSEHTGAMRMEKEYNRNGTDGEDFFDGIDEDADLEEDAEEGDE